MVAGSDGGGGSSGEGMEDEEGANLLDHIPVQLWRLVQTGRRGGLGEGGQDHHCVLQGIMNGLLFAGSPCSHLCAAAARGQEAGRETEELKEQEHLAT